MSFIYSSRYRSQRKTFVWALVMALVVTLLPAIPSANAQTTDELSGGAQYEKNPKELVDHRTKNSKTFVNPDGTLTTQIYERPIHVKDNSGKWNAIDNNLVVDDSGKRLRNKLNSYQVFFQKQNDADNLVELDQDQISIALSPANKNDSLPANFVSNVSNNQAITQGNQITYPDLYPGVDVRYTATNQKVKEDIILKEKPTDQTPTQFSFV